MANKPEHRIVILGGGFGGVFTARHLRQRAGSHIHVELISRNNFFVFQPLLPEVAGGGVHPSDAVSPLRLYLPSVKVRIAEVRKIDFTTNTVHVTAGRDREIAIVHYDQLVIALGQEVDLSRTPGLAERALVMKDIVDAFKVRNQVLGCLEEADQTIDPRRKRRLLTFVVIGGGFTGVETVGEVQELIRKALRHYPGIRLDEIRIVLIQHGARILPELPEHLATFAADALRRRRIEILLKTGVRAVGPTGIEIDGDLVLDAETIIAAIGNAPSPLMKSMQLPLQHGRIVVDQSLRVAGLQNVWALGDNALIPLSGDDSAQAPPLAQFAFREAKVLARNILASIQGHPLAAFEYKSLGTMASLGAHSGVAEILGVRVTGFLAWAAWKLLYLSLLPGWPMRIRVAIDWSLNLVFSRSIVEIRAAGSESRAIRLLAGDMVLEPGFEPVGVYVVTSGTFELSCPTTDVDEANCPSSRLGPGDCFGLSLDGKPPAEPQRVRACEDSTAYFIDRADLKRLAMVTALLERRAQTAVQVGPEST
ncbi:MAG: FAD-dependent oxidoreductase [Rhodospirillales bacterium]|nr:FAD-dependent oxidoreductase [Rhodospirillales bacterium]